jgi:hypothetical protein
MFGKIIGALVGEEIGKRRGHGGAGLVAGTLAVSAMRRMGPFGVAIGGAYVAKKIYDRYRARSV